MGEASLAEEPVDGDDAVADMDDGAWRECPGRNGGRRSCVSLLLLLLDGRRDGRRDRQGPTWIRRLRGLHRHESRDRARCGSG